ncbi:MAG: AAA family ATPase, partial [Planctomycetota bacterium]|nr:AAA family ATPase [Planctomycetota bacterium]
MIERVEFTNFKALRDVKIDLEQFTVLVGPNGSGKTSVLQGLDFLLSAVDEESACKAGPRLGDYPSALRNSWMDITGYGRGGSMILTVADPEEARDVISPRNPDGPESLEEFRYEDDSVSKRISIYRSGQAALEPFFFGRPILLRLDHKLLTAPSYSEEPTPRMQPNGEGLASVLDYLSSNKPDEFHAIIETLRHIIPTVRALRFPPAKVSRMDHEVRTLDGKEYTRYEPNTYWGKSIEFDMENAPQIPAHMVSEGTLLVLGLL